MAKPQHEKHANRTTIWLGLLCGAPFLASAALAQEAPPPGAGSNEEALKAWQAASGNQISPTVVKTDEGETRLEWRSTLAADAYNNGILPPPAAPGAPPTATPLNTGNFAKAVLATDIRLLEPGGQVNFMQFAVTASNDRSALARYRNQLNSFQLGRTGQGYQVGAGDAAINFSQLGSTLGLRGLSMQRQLGAWTLSSYGGVVAESWEALVNRTPLDQNAVRSRYLRNVVGAKVEYAVMPGLKAFTTLQGYRDDVPSLSASQFVQQPSDARSVSTGLAYQAGPWTGTTEVAQSRFEERYQLARRGNALLIDGTYRQATWSLRSGFHDIDPKYISLSQAVPPGVKEWYLGGDWTAAAWINLGMDYRDAMSRTAGLALLAPPADPALPPPFPVMATSTLTRALTSRANINFGPDLPGWALSLTNTLNRGEDTQQRANRNQNTNAALSYSSPTWTGNLTGSTGKVASVANPQGDSTTRGAQVLLGRTYQGSVIPWSLGWTLTGGMQTQRLIAAGNETVSRTHGLSLNGQRAEWAQFTFAYQGANISQTTGGPDLVTQTLQVEVLKQFGAQHTFKVYLRGSHRNIGDVLLRTDERVFGVSLGMTW